MKVVFFVFAAIYVFGIIAACVVLVSMGISSRDLWEIRNELEKEGGENGHVS